MSPACTATVFGVSALHDRTIKILKRKPEVVGATSGWSISSHDNRAGAQITIEEHDDATLYVKSCSAQFE